jgi:peptide subunit release factor 1 (eRF1)
MRRGPRINVKCTRCSWKNVRHRDSPTEAPCPKCTADVEVVREGDVPPRGLNERERKAAS